MVENNVIQLQSGHVLGVNLQLVIDLCSKLRVDRESFFEILYKIKMLERLGAYSWMKQIKKETKSN